MKMNNPMKGYLELNKQRGFMGLQYCWILAVVTFGSTGSAMASTADSGLVESPFKACQGVKLVSQEAYSKNQSEWDQRCRENPSEFGILPRTGIGFSELKSATESYAFLQKVGLTSTAILERNIRKMRDAQKCFASGGDKCKDIYESEITKAYQALPEVRKELALAEGADFYNIKADGKWGFSPKMVNSSLSKVGGVYRASDIESLSAQEMAEASAQMAKESEEKIFSKVNDRKVTDKKAEFNRNYALVQAEHKANYFAKIQQAPALLMIGSLPERKPENPKSEAEIAKKFAKAYGELVEGAEKELAKQRKILEGGGSDLMNLLTQAGTGQVIEQVLQENGGKANPKDCAIATGLYLQSQTDESVKSAALTVGMIAGASLANGLGGKFLLKVAPYLGKASAVATASGATALVLGPGYGGYYAYETNEAFKQARGAVAAGTGTMDALDKAESDKSVGFYSLPLGLFGTGLGAKAGMATFDAIAKGSLKYHGLPAEKARELIKLAKSSNPEIAAQARKEILNAVDGAMSGIFQGEKATAAELQTLAKAGENGYGEELMKSISKLSKEERRHRFNQFSKVFNSFEPTALESQDRGAAAKAIWSASKFWPSGDGTEIASFLKDSARRSESPATRISGLTRVLDRASEKMESPAYASIKNIEKRRAKAYEDSVNELLSSNQSFKNDTAAVRQGRLERLKRCILRRK